MSEQEDEPKPVNGSGLIKVDSSSNDNISISRIEFDRLKRIEKDTFYNYLDILEIMDRHIGSCLNLATFMFNQREAIKDIAKGNKRKE